MKTRIALVGLATLFLLSGCARDHAGATNKATSQPPSTPTGTATVNSTGAPPYYYQWRFNGTNAKTTEPVLVGSNVVFTVNSTGGAPITYQWYHGTNDDVVGDTNVMILQVNPGTNVSGTTNH